MDTFLIKNTTKEQRERIVKESLGYSDVGCDDLNGAYAYDMYQPYIDGELELIEIAKSFRANYIHGEMERPTRNDCEYKK